MSELHQQHSLGLSAIGRAARARWMLGRSGNPVSAFSRRHSATLTILMPVLLATISVGFLVSHGNGIMALAFAFASGILITGSQARARSRSNDVTVLVGRTPMAGVIASTLEMRGRKVARAVNLAEAASIIRHANCGQIILAGTFSPYPGDLRDARGTRPALLSGAEMLESLLGRVPLELVWNDRWLGKLGTIRPMSQGYASIKRIMDVTVMAGLVIMLLPLLPVVALLIKLDSPGPVFYSQTRVGLGGKLFQIYKFRTMRIDAEANGATWATENDPRITRFGRFMRATRIDELPQIWNVLRGEMSLIGPRPERPEFTTPLAKHLPGYDLRHSIKPGLTGWAQTCYRYTNTVRDTKAKVEYDLYYVKHLSLGLDLKILVKTVRVVVSRSGT